MRRQYSDNDKAAALAALDANGGNVYKTAADLGIARKTLEGWAKSRGTNGDVADLRHEKKIDLADKLEQVAYAYTDHLLDKDTIYKTGAKDAAITVGTAVDKMRLLRGLPTEIVSLVPDLVAALQAAGLDPVSTFNRMIQRAHEQAKQRPD